MERILNGIPGVIVYIDDILIFANSSECLKERTDLVLAALKENNLTLNHNKCEFEKESLKFLGHQLTPEGLDIDEQKIADIAKFREPKSTSELKSFLGLASYVGNYIPHFADITEPLWKVAGKGPFEWGKDQSEAFAKVKSAIINTTTKQGFFDVKDETFLYTDASPHALGAVLVQENEAGGKRVISFASKSLTPTERRYAQTQRDALAVVWAAEHYHYYLLGHKFTIRTDAEGIAYIFNRNGDAPKRLIRRAEGWAMRLDAFDFAIEFIKGSSNIADPSSRLYEGNDGAYEEKGVVCEIATVTVNEPVEMNFGEDHMPALEVAYETSKDDTLAAVKKALESGDWPQELANYKAVHEDLQEADGILIRTGLAVIPKALQNKALALAHEGHPGASKMKTILRERVWWPAMGRAAEDWVANCRACTLNSRKGPPTPMERTKLPESPWDFLAVDFCGPYAIFEGIYVLVMVDYYSRYMVAMTLKTTDFESTSSCFNVIFDQLGFPATMKTDNGPPFNSANYKTYCANRGIVPVFSWPLTPQQNGMAEKAMQTINKAMQVASVEGRDFRRTLAEAVRAHNTAIHRTTNEVLRRTLPLLGSATCSADDQKIRERDWNEKQRAKEREDKKRGAKENRIMVGDSVVLRRNTRLKGQSNYDPKELTVVGKRKGDLTMQTAEGSVVKRHVTLAKRVVSGSRVPQPPEVVQVPGARPRRVVKPPQRYGDAVNHVFEI